MRKTIAIIMMLAATTVSAESLIITTPDHTLSMYGCRVNASWYVQGPTPGRAFGAVTARGCTFYTRTSEVTLAPASTDPWIEAKPFGDGRSYQRCMVTGETTRPPSTEVWCADQLRFRKGAR